jgi:hypothetical protein
MASSADILKTLDGHAAEFEFPGFNNMNYETADSRLHCYRDGERWALVVEELVDWPGADGLMTLVFAMGDIRGEALRTLTPIDPIDGDEDDDDDDDEDDEDEDEDEDDEDEDEDDEDEDEDDEDDEDDEELVVPDQVVVRGKKIAIDRERVEATVETDEVEPGFAVLVHLIESHRDALFCTPAELEESVAPGLVRILTLDEWSHPDVYGGPKPSESETFRQLAEVLATGDTKRWAPTEPPNNRDWKAWLGSR